MPRCVRCGKEVQALIEGLCIDCFIYTRGIDTLFKAAVDQCPVCGRIRIDNKWTDNPSDLSSWLARKIGEKYSKIFNKYGLMIRDVELSGDSFIAKIPSENSVLVFKGKIELSFRRSICPLCLREKQESFEAVIQVRAEDEEDIKKIREVVDTTLSTLPPERASEILVIDELKEGLDLKVYSHSTARFIANRIKALYPSELKETHKLITIKGGKRQSKLTISVRLLKTSGYEIVYYKNKPALVTYLSSGKIKLLLHNGNSLLIDRKTLDRETRVFRGTVEEVMITNIDEEHVYVRKHDSTPRRIPLEKAFIHAPVGSRAILVEDEDGIIVCSQHPNKL
jgi:NMD protein affecting ribosome stability and mRNA decay